MLASCRLSALNVHRQLVSTRSPSFRVTQRQVTFDTRTFNPNPRGHNHSLIRHLQKKFEEERIAEQDAYKARAFLRAVKALEIYPEPIEDLDKARKINGIGDGMARRIDEFLHPESQPAPKKSGKKEKAAIIPEDEERKKAMKELSKVSGIGPVKALRLFDAGCRTIEELSDPKYSAMLTAPVRAGLSFVGCLERTIMREHIELLQTAVRNCISSDFDFHIVGNFRRGQKYSSAIEIILFHPSYVHVPSPLDPSPSEDEDSSTLPQSENPPKKKSRSKGRTSSRVTTADIRTKQEELLSKSVVDPLTQRGILAGPLSVKPREWSGFVRIPIDEHGNLQESEFDRLRSVEERRGRFARIDLSIHPLPSRGAALLTSTGDADFLSYIRTTASRMGLLLNNYGLWKWKDTSKESQTSDAVPESPQDTGASQVKPRKGSPTSIPVDSTPKRGYWELIASKTEEDILEELGMEYIVPEKRNFAFISGRSRARQQV